VFIHLPFSNSMLDRRVPHVLLPAALQKCQVAR
jgi:hypothetical protein